MGSSSFKVQCLAGFSVAFASVMVGIPAGWTSPYLILFQSLETPLPCGPLTENDLSWVVSIMFMSAFVNTIVSGWLISFKGRLWTLRFAAFPAIISWIFVYFAQNQYYLIFSRFLIGISAGLVLVAWPVYVAETVENRIRGIVGTCCVMCNQTGILLGYAIGHYFSFKVATIIFGLVPILFLLFSLNLHESPFYLVTQNKWEEAKKNLEVIRNVNNISKLKNEDFRMELEVLQTQYSQYNQENGNTTISNNRTIPDWKHFVTPSAKRGLLLSLTLVTLNQFSGNSVIQSYASTIFKESGSNLEPNISAIIVGSIQFVGVLTVAMVVDRLGRRFLIILSTMATALGLTVMSSFAYIKSLGYDVDGYLWIPLASVSFIVFVVTWGTISLTFLLIAEVLPEKIRSVGMAISISFLWLLGALTTQLFYVMSTIIGMHGIMMFFACSCYVGSAVLFKYLPETKGKSLSEIQEILLK